MSDDWMVIGVRSEECVWGHIFSTLWSPFKSAANRCLFKYPQSPLVTHEMDGGRLTGWRYYLRLFLKTSASDGWCFRAFGVFLNSFCELCRFDQWETRRWRCIMGGSYCISEAAAVTMEAMFNKRPSHHPSVFLLSLSPFFTQHSPLSLPPQLVPRRKRPNI